MSDTSSRTPREGGKAENVCHGSIEANYRRPGNRQLTRTSREVKWYRGPNNYNDVLLIQNIPKSRRSRKEG